MHDVRWNDNLSSRADGSRPAYPPLEEFAHIPLLTEVSDTYELYDISYLVSRGSGYAILHLHERLP